MGRNGHATGAYGLLIAGLGEPEILRVKGSADWPTVRISHGVGERGGEESSIGERRAVYQLPDAELVLDRDRREARLTTEREFSIDEIVHPYLSPVGNVFARWDGRETLHGGAFSVRGGAWSVLGDSTAGKSTTLAWLATHGCEVVSDDVAVLERGAVLSGPRCLDVRDDVSEHLSVGSPASRPREGGRNRVALPPIAPAFPLRGFVYLEWGDRVEVERVPPPARLARLQPPRQVVRLHSDPVEQLDLAALPALVLRRPRGLDELDRAGEELLAALVE